MNSKVSVHTYDIKSHVTRKMDLPLDEDGYIPRIKFTSDPEKLAIMTLNRHQNRFDIYILTREAHCASLLYATKPNSTSRNRLILTLFSIRKLS